MNSQVEIDCAAEFARFAAIVKEDVDAALSRWLNASIARYSGCGADVRATLEAVRSLSTRGGKRLRAALLAAAYEACGGEEGAAAVSMGGVSVELFQTYLLIHDDWMDHDDVRRGGPSVHAMLRSHFQSEKKGDVSAVLAGDYACALAQGAFFAMSLPKERITEAALVFANLHEEVVVGQLLDTNGHAKERTLLETMHDLKTGSYTTRGPLTMGAILAGATPAQRGALQRFGTPLGIAFQLRDDLLGTFGDPRSTGKAPFSDIRQGKRTALVLELERSENIPEFVIRCIGREDATTPELEKVAQVFVTSGAKRRVEARLAALLGESRAALRTAPFTERGKRLLLGATNALGTREK